MELRRSSFNFSSSRDEAQSASETLEFSRNVLRVGVGIIGYSARYDNNDDHHLGRLIVEMGAGIDSDDPTKVNVTGNFGLRDWSGEFDDSYSGNIQWVVLVDLAAAPTPLPGDPRSDLIITGAEITQVIQHFRSAEHLDSPNVFPDNSIRLVANKPTVVRYYVDYDRNSGLPPISLLSGELEVISGSMTQVLTPATPITPRRNASIDRGIRNHTLNFFIPENLCLGTVELKAKVFNNSDDTQFSAELLNTLNFEAMPAVRVIAVGVNYTGDNIDDGAQPSDLTAPTMMDFVDVFGLTEKTYPIPEVVISSYQTIDYDGDLESDISEGCDKFGDLLDELDDFKGDSDDIVFGLINRGVNNGSVGGCGRNGVAAGTIGKQDTAAHELGHAFGRKHAPCDNVTRCADPLNTDDNYPIYSGYDSDSIGEYGFDPVTAPGRVFSPANAHDFMGYSNTEWISPYTYKALMTRIPDIFGTAGASASSSGRFYQHEKRSGDNEWVRIKTPHLFIRVDIDREKQVTFHDAFHFDCLPRAHGNEKTDFSVRLLDKDGKVIKSSCLYADIGCCSCGCNSPVLPVKIRQAVSYSAAAKILVLLECEKEIYRIEIKEPPKVSLDCSDHDDAAKDSVLIKWHADAYAEIKSVLLQWMDKYGVWRGCCSRTQEKEIRIPKYLFRRGQEINLRVLATTGIATGMGIWNGKCIFPPYDKNNPENNIGIAGISRENKTVELPPVIKAAVTRNSMSTHYLPEINWYNERGAQIGTGKNFNLASLPYGQTLLAAAVLDSGQGGASGQWLVERTRDGRFLLLRGDTGTDKKNYLNQSPIK